MKLVLAIAAGGAAGTVLRHFANAGITHFSAGAFPWGIFAVNVLGSFLMGGLIAFFSHAFDPSQTVKAFLTVGLLGGFTTFSTFSLDAALLIERGQFAAAAFYVAGSVILAIGGLFAGMALVRMVAA